MRTDTWNSRGFYVNNRVTIRSNNPRESLIYISNQFSSASFYVISTYVNILLDFHVDIIHEYLY